MNRKNIFATFIKYTSLSMLSMIGLSCYILADTLFIANGVGPLGLTALNLDLPIYRCGSSNTFFYFKESR